MRRSTCLRLGAIAIILLGSLGLSASQVQAARSCPKTGDDYPYVPCGYGCQENTGFCDSYGFCVCGEVP
jgi:hypothetical protein